MKATAGIAVTAATCFGLFALLVAAAPPAGDAAAGKLEYARCIGCHSPDRNRTGPRHCGLIGRTSGTLPGYDYSEAMRTAAIPWTSETLDQFLAAPMTVVPGTTMGFAGVADERERRDLVAYLASLTPSAEECSDVQMEN
jgi:cytochrome c